ncbi:MAG: OsmC family protein [Sideroxyarcus sp.]|nr:OsmC family protein [Sideroxyarcus sp.]
MSETQTFSLTLEQQEDYAFLLRFDDAMPELLTDEPPPLGQGSGPNPSRLLAASVANCLMASLLFSLRKFKNDPGRLTARATGHYTRNEQGRLRVGGVAVEIRFAAEAASLAHLDRALAQFEEFCVVTQSVRSGFPVALTVRDGSGKVLKGNDAGNIPA